MSTQPENDWQDLYGEILLPESSIRPPFEPDTVHIPAGPFVMGTTDEQIRFMQKRFAWVRPMRFDDERPAHEVTLLPYRISRCPITNGQYHAFVEGTGRPAPFSWTAGRPRSGELDYPVRFVSWHDAQAYVAWLREQTGQYYRLPTEAEWEKAACGTDGRIYPWGNEPPDERRCNFDDRVVTTTPVGQYSPQGDSPYGCADMAGNVSEWCQSLYRPYPYKANDGREDLDQGDSRVLRGGTFYDNEGNVRCASRFGYRPDLWNGEIGFRVVVAPGTSGGGRCANQEVSS